MVIGSFLRHRPATVVWPSGSWRMAISRRSAWREPAATGPGWPVICARSGSVWSRSTGLTVGRAAPHGKSDPLDAYAAARAVVSGLAAVVPKLRRRPRRGHPDLAGGPLERGQSPYSDHESDQGIDRDRPIRAARAAASSEDAEDRLRLRPPAPVTSWATLSRPPRRPCDDSREGTSS